MSEISERYARLSQEFADKIAEVPSDKWDAQSPCDEWKARDVVEHVIATQGMFLGLVKREMPELPDATKDPLAAWNAARAAIQHDLEDPKLAGEEFDGSFGKSTFEAAVNKFLCMDLVVHGWDLARAAGLDDEIEPDDLAVVKEQAAELGDAMRSPKAFGPVVDVPASADEQTKVLAYLGREA